MPGRRIFVWICLCAAVLIGPSVGHAAGSHIAFSVSPHTVKPAGKVTLRASHLSPRATYFFMFQPTKQPKLKGLVGAARASSKGSITKSMNLPLIPYCGPAVIQLFNTHKVLAKAGIAMSGCKAGSPSPPPAPPSHRR